MFGGAKPEPAKKAPRAAAAVQSVPMPKCTGPKGLYLWGGCGTGKTFVMDMFYACCPVKKKTRIHFHEWMIDVHERLHRLAQERAMVKDKADTEWTAGAVKAQREQLAKQKSAGGAKVDDLVELVADEMMSEAWLLCFDEFQVTHITDAIIMKRLFTMLFERGAIVVATSNRPPEELYLNGLNRPLFVPFIPLVSEFCNVHDIASEMDYRLTSEGEDDDKRVYIFPNGEEENRQLERKFYRLCRNKVVTGGQLEAQKRKIPVPKAAVESNIAWFRFKDLCDKPLGASDYLAIASGFHSVFIADIPRMTLQERDQVRRFITLVDTFYERHTKLVCTAETSCADLFYVSEEEKRTSQFDEVFAWDRTASRLTEMQSIEYLTDVSRRIDAEQFAAQFDFDALADEDLVELWRRYDADDSGVLDEDEISEMFADILEKKVGHRNIPRSVVKHCFQVMDEDNSGGIDFDEFKKLTEMVSLINEQDLEAQFRPTWQSVTDDEMRSLWAKYDKDQDQMLCPEEFRDLLRDVMQKHRGHRNLSDEVIDMCFRDIGMDGHGGINYRDFKKSIRQLTSKGVQRRPNSLSGGQPGLGSLKGGQPGLAPNSVKGSQPSLP
jgi:predicted ATPase/Ca2+-binding EF-hand superfamily protein